MAEQKERADGCFIPDTVTLLNRHVIITRPVFPREYRTRFS